MGRGWRLYAQYKMDQWSKPFSFVDSSNSSNSLEGYAEISMINKVLEKIFKNWQVARITHSKVERQFSSPF